jgi:lysine-N-methylase
MLDHLRPHYAKNFHCIGTRCEDNCCRGWDVFIDKATYQRYQSLPALRPIMDERFVRLNDDASDDRYALIRDVSSSVCRFLSSDRLCRIQQEYGDAYLSVTCATYPRIPRRIDGLLEQPLSLSCPEAARLVLLNPQLIPDDPTVAGDRRYARS